jgi:uncharacterized protein YndB with AHSA1/START domain
MSDLTAYVSLVIDAPIHKVWDGLTDPEIIKQYFFGTQLETDWKKGSPISWRGEWEGVSYEDKGTIVDIIPERHVKFTYWSSMSNLPDLPENYTTVTYDLSSEGDNQTRLVVTQDNMGSPERKKHSEENWMVVLEGLKKIVEGQ